MPHGHYKKVIDPRTRAEVEPEVVPFWHLKIAAVTESGHPNVNVITDPVSDASIKKTKDAFNSDQSFDFASVGTQSARRVISLKSAQHFIVTFIIPWVALITFITNMVVCVLCAIIYSKTKKQNHKPAFFFIGCLALFDMLSGGYVSRFICVIFVNNLTQILCESNYFSMPKVLADQA